MQTFRKLPTASPKNAENIVNNRWPSSILSTVFLESKIEFGELFVSISFDQHVFVFITVAVWFDCFAIALLETENTYEVFGFRRLAVIRLDKVDFKPRGDEFFCPLALETSQNTLMDVISSKVLTIALK